MHSKPRILSLFPNLSNKCNKNEHFLKDPLFITLLLERSLNGTFFSFFSCNATSVSTFPQCLINGTDHVTSNDVLRNFGIDIPLYCHVSSLVILFFVLRLAAYVALRCRHTVLR